MNLRRRTPRPLRWMALVALFAIVATTLAACGDDDDATATPALGASTATSAPASTPDATAEATQDTGEMAEVSIALDWYPWGNHSGLYLAEQNGYFDAEGLDVSIYVPGDPTTGLQLVATGRDTFTISYQTDVLLARAEGLEVVSVAALVQHPLNSIMALESSGIERPADLEGRTIGIAGVASDEPLLSSMLEADGLTLDDVELVTVGFDLMPALLGGTVDAVIGAYWVHESILAEQQGEPVNVIRIEEWGVPDHYELVLVTSEQVIEDSPEVVESFIRALRLGYADADADRESAIAALVAASPETDADLEREGIDLLAPFWTDEGTVAFGTQTQERWANYAEWLLDNGIISEAVPVEEAFTNEFVERAQEARSTP